MTAGTSSGASRHLPRARGRLEAGVRKGVARPYGGDGTRRWYPMEMQGPTLRRGRDPSSALPPQDDSAARCAGRRGHPEERETRDVPSSAHPHAVTTGTSSVIRLAGDRRMPPSPCAGKAFGGRPQGRSAPLRRRRCAALISTKIRGSAPAPGGEILPFVQDDSTTAAFRFSSKLKSENQNKNQIKKGCESKLSHPFCFT